jgi:hypothetical protein
MDPSTNITGPSRSSPISEDQHWRREQQLVTRDRPILLGGWDRTRRALHSLEWVSVSHLDVTRERWAGEVGVGTVPVMTDVRLRRVISAYASGMGSSVAGATDVQDDGDQPRVSVWSGG